MNYKPEYVTAIDIGTTKVVAIVGKKNKHGKLEILGLGKTPSTGVKRGVVLNIEETANAIQKSVQEAEEHSGIQFSDVFVGIAGQHIKSIKNRGYRFIDQAVGEITQEDVENLTLDMYKIPIQAGEEIIHVIPQNYIVDSETGVKQPVGMSGQRLEANFHIVVGQIASAKNIKKCTSRAGLNVQKIVLQPLASAEAVLTDDEKEAGVALVDIGGGTTDVAVYHDGIIRHTAVIPFGGNVVTSDIREGCSILQRHAESLKIQFGSALSEMAPDDKVVTIPGINGRESKEISFRSLASIIQARMEEIIDAVYFELENSGYLNKLSAGIVLTGGGALMRHLTQLVKFRTGFDVRIGLPNIHFSANVNDEVNHSMYATGIGLLLKAFDQNDTISQPSDMMDSFDVEEIENKEQVVIETPIGLDMDDKESLQQKEGFLSIFKRNIKDIFEEKDSSM